MLFRSSKAVATVAEENLAEAVDAFVEKGVFNVDDVRPLFAAAKKAGLAVTMHADQLNDVGASAFAARAHARSADHVAHASADGIRALARAEVPAVLLPGSAFFVGYPPPEARRFIAARVPVALASDCRIRPFEDRKSTRLNSSHPQLSRMPSSA